jgi:CBS domain-containing protein
MQVRDLMTEDVVTVGVERSLRTGARRMLRRGVGSIVAVHDGVPVGIVTETDALRAGATRDATFADIPIGAVMSRPLVYVRPDQSVRSAVERMRDEDVKKLPVRADLELVGVLTLTDVVRNLDAIRKEAADLVRSHEGWELRR